ncbi:flagellar hook-length control protein FliK [Saccharophagus degradans]|uniref:Flagellar hook-length control protein FliK n=1 Tax=Saccharophagus degradans TaxID=86304 RepID=A0AAW7X285_9GAMM|nr:flagellar hook-length control protein FliK [Saccharophagus degradans]MDO6421012.1 flagellar hook-length control protein FliK [Saccharophagus degradans]MDO6606077.1 flagellar hook-length control protein FliK [Saccharophagus degradans]
MVMQTTDTLLKLDSTQANTFGNRDRGVANNNAKDSFKNAFENERSSSAKIDKKEHTPQAANKSNDDKQHAKTAVAEASSQQNKAQRSSDASEQGEGSDSGSVQSTQSSNSSAEADDQKQGDAESNTWQVKADSESATQEEAKSFFSITQADEAAVEGVLAAFGLGPIGVTQTTDNGISMPLDVPASAALTFGSVEEGAMPLASTPAQSIVSSSGLTTVSGLASSIKSGVANGQQDETASTFNNRPISAFIAREQGAQPLAQGVGQNGSASLNPAEQQLNLGQSSAEPFKQSSLSFAESLVATSAKTAGESPLTAISNASEHGSMLSSPNSASASQARLVMPATISFGQPQWAGMVAERAASMALQNIQFAELQLDPADLGPVHIKVTTHQDQATVVFTSANQQVREALDQSLAKLRDMMAEEGMDLVDASVSDQSAYDQQDSNSSDDERTEQPALTEAEKQEREAQQQDQPTTNITATYGVDSYA